MASDPGKFRKYLVYGVQSDVACSSMYLPNGSSQSTNFIAYTPLCILIFVVLSCSVLHLPIKMCRGHFYYVMHCSTYCSALIHRGVVRQFCLTLVCIFTLSSRVISRPRRYFVSPKYLVSIISGSAFFIEKAATGNTWATTRSLTDRVIISLKFSVMLTHKQRSYKQLWPLSYRNALHLHFRAVNPVQICKIQLIKSTHDWEIEKIPGPLDDA